MVAFGSSNFSRDHASKMMNARYLRISVIFVIVLALLSGVMLAKGKADKLFKDGQAAEAKEDWDKALELYLQAIDVKPNDPNFMIAMRRARFEAGEMHVQQGQKVRAEGKLAEAMGEFQKALWPIRHPPSRFRK